MTKIKKKLQNQKMKRLKLMNNFSSVNVYAKDKSV